MKPILIALTCLSIASPALACGSYEECMKGESYNKSGHVEPLIKAIAYKLDEISKKLDKETSTTWIVGEK